jgi:hypothetical protein
MDAGEAVAVPGVQFTPDEFPHVFAPGLDFRF